MNPIEISSLFSISVTASVQISSTDKWWVENRLTLVIYYKREVSLLCYSFNTAEGLKHIGYCLCSDQFNRQVVR